MLNDSLRCSDGQIWPVGAVMTRAFLILGQLAVSIFVGGCVALDPVADFGNVAPCAATLRFQPAQLVESPEQEEIISGLVAPWASDSIEIYATAKAIVDTDGRIGEICCLTTSPEFDKVANKRLIKRLSRLHFFPATQDGNKVKVVVGLSIVSRKTDAGNRSSVFMNHLLSADDYGLQYTAPQRIYSPRMAMPKRPSGFDLWVEIVVSIDSKGIPSDSRVSRLKYGPRRMIDELAEIMNGQCFIPGFADGVAFDMPYSEVFKTPGPVRKWTQQP